MKVKSEQLYGDLDIDRPEGVAEVIQLEPPGQLAGEGGFGLPGFFDVPEPVEETPPSPTEEEPAAAPLDKTPGGAPVQETGLNGAQITALQELLQSVADGTQSAEVVRELIRAAFPSMDPQSVDKMVRAADRFTPRTPPEANAASRVNPDVIAIADSARQERAIAGAAEEWARFGRGLADEIRALARDIGAKDANDAKKCGAFANGLAGLLSDSRPDQRAGLLSLGQLAGLAVGALQTHALIERRHAASARQRDAIVLADGGAAREPFLRAVRAFASRADVVTPERFAQLEGASKQRAWTMARITDADMLTDVHRALGKSIGGGETFRDFLDSLNDIKDGGIWKRTTINHARQVFDMNVGMAYTAGRYDQARQAGVEHWRYLPSTSAVPREEHKKFYGKVYRMGEGPMPPLDYGCNCGWEIVLKEELKDVRIAGDGPKIPAGQQFRWRPKDFFGKVTVKLADYPKELHGVLRRLAAEDAQFNVALR